MWDFIPKCEILIMKTLNFDSNNHQAQSNMFSMSPGRNPDLNMLLRHCSWVIMEFLIFGDTEICMRFYSEMWDFIRNMRFYSWNPSILTPMIINIQSNMISVNREEPRLKDCWDIALWMSYGISGLGGCEILFMMWDFIPKCGILVVKTLNLDS